MSAHVSSDRLGEAARYGGLDNLRETERRHIGECERCRRLYGGYRLTDRLLAAGWREVALPPAAMPAPSRRRALAGLLDGLNTHALAPILAAIALIALVGAAIALPRLISGPTATSRPSLQSPTAVATPSPSGRATPGATGDTAGRSPDAGGTGTAASGSTLIPGPSQTGRSGGLTTLKVTRTGGSPIAWSPDGAHLLSWASGSGHQLQIRDSSGRITGTVTADAATWVGPSTIAIATHAQATPSATGSLVHGSGGPGHRGNPSVGPTNRAVGDTVGLIDVSGRATATLPGSYPLWGGVANGMLVGSGSGELVIAGQDSFGWHFVLWNGSLSASQKGLPIAFSQDGSRLAVLHSAGAWGYGVSGSLEILSVPALTSVGSYSRLNLRVGGGSLGSAFGFDAAFSPDGRSLLVSGTLVDLGRGSTLATGRGGWLPDGTLVTASNSGLVLWHGSTPTPDQRFPGAGTVATSRHGELIYFYNDARPALLLDTDGTLYALSLPGVRSISGLLISPSGRAIAFGGRATDGSPITAVANLP
jgi:hypothetical protein